MKLFRCPWCGSQCINATNKSLFFRRSIISIPPDTRNFCPDCNRGYTYKWSWRTVIISAISILATILSFFSRYTYATQDSVALTFLFVLVILFFLFIIHTILNYFFSPIVRCGNTRFSLITIPTQFVIETTAPIFLRQENIFAITFDDKILERKLRKHAEKRPFPVYLKISHKHNTYYMGLLQTDDFCWDVMPDTADIQVVLGNGDTIPAKITACDPPTHYLER